jgi:uncharacterized repeat protein (TIGR03803 family)
VPQARRLLIGSLAGLAAFVCTTSFAPAQASEALIYTFKGGSDGGSPSALVADAHGALYGTTWWWGGASSNYGTVFKLTPPASSAGQWTETVLYRFKGGSDGAGGSNLIFDKYGALYGTSGYTSSIGGNVFKLTPPASGNGQWTETVLYSFKGSDAAYPSLGGLTFDAEGALYGATFMRDTVFKLTPPTSGRGQWTKTVLHSFTAAEGSYPEGGLLFDKQGALYGATQMGPASQSGTVFKLTPPASGKGPWTITVLHSFTYSVDGQIPVGLVFDNQGALYGTTQSGGPSGNGTVFRLKPPSSGKGPWTETVLADFAGATISMPYCKPLFDADGNLYGTTIRGSSTATSGGSAFKLTPPASGTGKWKLSLLHGFSSSPGKGGSVPEAGLIVGHDGAFYGTLSQGGNTANGQGAVYRLQIP